MGSQIKLWTNRGQILAPRLGPGVVVPCSTLDEKDWCVVLVAVLTGLSRELLSRDSWSLAMLAARQLCLERGLPEDRVDQMLLKVANIGEIARRSNPLSGMF